MKVTSQKEDIQILATTLQEQLLLELPSVQVLEVRCAIKNDALMILTQHPSSVVVDTDEVFTILEEYLQWQPQYDNEKVQFYVRISGEKLPYAQHSIIIHTKGIYEEPEIPSPEASNGLDENVDQTRLIFPPLEITEVPSLATENDISDNSFGSLTEDNINISDNSFSSLTEDNINISDNSFSSLTEDNINISDNSFSSLTEDNINISDNSFSSLTEDNISDNSLSSLTHDNGDNSFSSLTNDNRDNSFSSLTEDNISDNSFSSLTEDSISNTTFSSDNSLDEIENPLTNEPISEEKFDPFAGGENLSNRRKNPLSLPPLPILLGGALGIMVIFGGGAFFLNRSCVIGNCKILQIAQQLQSDSQQLLSQAKSTQELVTIKDKIDQAISNLTAIPQWSPRYQSAQELTLAFSNQSKTINQVVTAFKTASTAEQKNKTPATSLDEIRSRQTLWRQAITPLESIKPDSQIYGLVKASLTKYKNNLQAINQQLLTEETWDKKLTTAKTVANSAIQQQANAKSGNDWQKIQFSWQQVINSVKSVPKTSIAYEEAQKLLVDYQPQLILARNTAKREIAAVKKYQQAVNFANQAKAHQQKNQWQAAVASWQQALETAKQVSQDSYSYSQAQSLIQAYSTATVQAQENLQLYGNLSQTRNDLQKTCFNNTRFCVFSIETKGIIVRLTSEYDQALQNNNPSIQNHFRTLREALGVISDNAKLPIFLYNSQGQERYMRQPQ